MRIAIAAGVFLALFFSFNMGGYDLWPADEPRYGEVSREMLETGDFLAPHVNGEPYTEKPPLLFWSIAAASIPFGEVNAFSARIPSVAAALITCWLTFLLARDLFDRRVAWLAVAILATCGRFWWQARTVQIDMLLTACLTGALYVFWRWHNDRRRGWLVAFYGLIALAVYAKGPPGVVFPLLLIFAFYWKQREPRRQTRWGWGVVAVALAIAAWLVPARLSIADATQVGVQTGIGENLFRQTIGRFVLGVNHAEMPWYYLENLPVDWLPWSIFAPFAAVYAWRHRSDGASMRLLLAWTVPAFLFFSISVGKRAVYLMPLYPAMAILIAVALRDLYESNREKWLRGIGYAWFVFLAIVAVGPFILLATEYAHVLRPPLFLVSAASVVGAAVYVVCRRRHVAYPLAIAVAVHAVCLETAVASIVLPAINPYKSAADFCAPMRQLNQRGIDYDLYSLGFSREEYIFYSERHHTPLVYDLMTIQGQETMDAMEAAEIQVRLRKKLEKAMESVAVSSYAPIPDGELEALHARLDAVLHDNEIPPGLGDAFRDALIGEMAPLFQTFEKPTLIMVQEDDYKWLLPVTEELENYRLMKQQGVGSREMLLLANPAAVALLDGTSELTAE